jgi:hypothetical protein
MQNSFHEAAGPPGQQMVRENRSSRQPESHRVHLTGLYFKDSSPLQSNYVLECNVLGAENDTLEALRVVNAKLLVFEIPAIYGGG